MNRVYKGFKKIGGCAKIIAAGVLMVCVNTAYADRKFYKYNCGEGNDGWTWARIWSQQDGQPYEQARYRLVFYAYVGDDGKLDFSRVPNDKLPKIQAQGVLSAWKIANSSSGKPQYDWSKAEQWLGDGQNGYVNLMRQNGEGVSKWYYGDSDSKRITIQIPGVYTSDKPTGCEKASDCVYINITHKRSFDPNNPLVFKQKCTAIPD